MSYSDDIKAVFIEEAQDIVQRVLDSLDGFLTAPDRAERFNTILRGIHTIKGGAASCGFIAVKNEAHALEGDLQAYKGRPEHVESTQIQRIQRSLALFEDFFGGKPFDDESMPPSPTGTNNNDTTSGFFLFADDDQAPARVEAAPPATQITAPSQAAPPPITSATSTSSKTKAPAEVIRVPVERIQRNSDIIGEIFLTRNQLRHLAEQRMAASISDEIFFRNWEMLDHRLRQNIRDLEQNAMAMRLMSVKSLLRRMEMTVKSFTETAGKDIRIELGGEDTEIDKRIVDTLGEPLIHLVRNAMDHGIEPPSERLAVNKNPIAVIRLEVSIQGNEVLVSVSDDGRGIEPQKILESARRKGLDTSGVKTREDMLNLIFMPGFSTKEVVSEVSGRGVGMDAVKTYVDEQGGAIAIVTETNKGTRFNMRLPLGLAVVPAIIAVVNGRLLAVATADIVEIFQASPKDIVEVANDRGKFYKLRGDFLPCVDLKDHIFRAPLATNQLAGQSDAVAICIIESKQGGVAIKFDALQSNAEIALKSVPDGAAKLPYVTGVSTLATGEAVFVVSLSRFYDQLAASQPRSNKQDPRHEAA